MISINEKFNNPSEMMSTRRGDDIYNLSLMDEKIKNIYNSHQKVE